MGNLNSNRYIKDHLKPEVVPGRQCFSGVVFQQDIVRPYVANNTFFLAQQTQLFPWSVYSTEMSPVQHDMVFVCRYLALVMTPSRN